MLDASIALLGLRSFSPALPKTRWEPESSEDEIPLRKTVTILLAAVLIGLAMLGVALVLAQPETKFSYTNTTKQENVTTSVSAAAGETFVIRLASNPSTGYDWKVSTTPGLAYLNYTSAGGSSAIGSPVLRDYAFKSLEAGTSTITLVYERAPPSFSVEQIAITLVITVTVTG